MVEEPTRGNAAKTKAQAKQAEKVERANRDNQSDGAARPERGASFAAIRGAASSLFKKNPHAVIYGVIGFITALLILIVGFWPTLLIVVLVSAGVAIGCYRDGNEGIRKALSNLMKRIG